MISSSNPSYSGFLCNCVLLRPQGLGEGSSDSAVEL